MSERNWSRRQFMFFSALTAADLAMPRKSSSSPPEIRQILPTQEIHYQNFPHVKSSDFKERDIRNCNSSGPLSLASTFISLGIVENQPDDIKGIVARGLITDNWQAKGTDLELLEDLAHSYGVGYKTHRVSHPHQLLQLSQESPAPLLLQHKPDGSRFIYTNLVAGIDLYNNLLTLYNPNSSNHFSDININQYFEDYPDNNPTVLLPSTHYCPVLDSDGLAKYLSPEVLNWRQQILASVPDGFPPNAAACIIQIESGGHPGLVSSAGAMGLMQVMPFHFKQGEDPFDPHTNIKTGCRVFIDYLNMAFRNNLKDKEAIIQAATNYSGGSRQYGRDFHALLSRDHQGIDNFFRRRTGN